MKKPKFKTGDWVKSCSIKQEVCFGHIGKITAVVVKSPLQGARQILYWVAIQGKDYLLNEIELKQYSYIHKEISVGWFRASVFKLGKMFTVRFEISRGWNR